MQDGTAQPWSSRQIDPERRDGSSLSQLISILVLGLAALGLGLIGWGLIDGVQGRSLIPLIRGRENPLTQLVAGTMYGIGAGSSSWWIGRQVGLAKFTRRLTGIEHLVRTPATIIYVSVCAGIGEEILFRGALQHWLGILVTAILFVVVHGYLNPRDRRLSLYGVFLVAIMIPFRLAAARWGLIAPMVAHAVIDIVLFSAWAFHTTKDAA